MKKFFIYLTGVILLTLTVSSVVGNDNLYCMMELNVEALANTETNDCNNAAFEYDTEGGIFAKQKNFRRCGDCSWTSGYHPKYGC